jgi:YaiO family outer membrane protein
VGGTPDADFRERYAVAGGTDVRLSGPGGRFGPLLGTLDARVAPYPGARVLRVVPGLQYYLLDGQLTLSAAAPSTFELGSTDTGWRVRADIAPASLPVGFGIGYADAPETVDGETRTTRAVFGYVRWALDATRELRLDLADEDRERSYRRDSITLDLAVRF